MRSLHFSNRQSRPCTSLPYDSNQRRRRERCGASATEFALIVPLMILFAFGLIEVRRLMLAKQTATHETLEGEHIAVRPTSDKDDVIERVNEELALLQIGNASVETVPQSIEIAEPVSQVTVRMRVNIAAVRWIPNYFDFATDEVVAEPSMRRESTN